MVSPLWIASSEGRLEEVQDLLRTASNADVNVKGMCGSLVALPSFAELCIDSNGITPLIEAVKNGHVEVVHALLAHGTNVLFSIVK